jgi:hypothetical protein
MIPVLNTDSKTRRVVELLTKLATPHEPFQPTWEHDRWIAKQEDVFFELYRKHQDNARVVALLRQVDGGSRLDCRYSDPVRRALRIAPRYLELVLRDIKEANTCPTMPPTGDPVFDAWSENRQVTHGAWGTESKRQTVREQNKNLEYEVAFDGYVRERPKK